MSSNQSQYKFKEGDNHQFKITGFTEIPGTEESFYILENNIGGKHLLKSSPFKHYNLEIGKQVICKIDKINCSGKIFLEPKNPIYKEGEIYDFDFVKIIDHVNSVGENEKAAIVKDHFGMEVLCSLPFNTQIKKSISTIKCKVLRIKKGQLFLAHIDTKYFNADIKIGQVLPFTIIDIKQLEQQNDYYILKDEFNNSYSLKKDMYQHYGFKIGDTINCSTTKYDTDGHIKIEPVHPYYEIGKTYVFNYIKTIEEEDPLGNKEFVVLVADIYKVETKVRSNLRCLKTDLPDQISCKVEGIRKGKAILSLA